MKSSDEITNQVITKEEQEKIEQQQKYFYKYNINHLRRNLKFYEDKDNDLCALATFPRSGSSLFLNIIEGITKHFCGEDMYEGISLESIAKGNVRGTVDYCKIVRTHYPWLSKFPYRIKEDIKVVKAAYMVRNPFRNFTSLFGMLILNSHENNLPLEEYNKRSEDFDKFIKISSEAYDITSNFWVDSEVPVVILRYEDLMENPVKFCKDFFSLFEGTNDIDNDLPELVIEINEYFNKNGLKSTFLDSQKSSNDQYSYFTQEQKEFIYSKTKNWIKFFNYEQDVMDNTENIIDKNINFKVNGTNNFIDFNKISLSNIKDYKNDRIVYMTYNDGELEKKLVDPLVPITKFD